MNYWQFKFNMKKGEWKEFKIITAGEKFSQSTTKNLLAGCIGDIVFYYRSDKDRGIYFIAEIISEPYQEETNIKYAIDLKIIKRLESYYDYEHSFPELHDYYNTSKIRKRVQIQECINNKFNPQGLYRTLMEDSKNIKIIDTEIDNNILDNTNKIKQKYIDNGYLFNTFHNLNLIRGEVKHLAFIGNLLNPLGNHFKDDLFLNYFIESLVGYEDLEDNQYLLNFTKNNPKVIVEKTIKNNKENIGRIDLWLESDDFIIAIEGKIEANDNEGQLEKYDNYLKNQDKKYLLLYLTLRKDERAKKIDIETLENCHLLNFEQDILEFINNSMNDENIKDSIYSTLLDYEDALIKYMYNYHLSFEYSYELIDTMTKSKDIFEKYQQIKEHYYQNIEECKHTVIEDIANNFEYAKANIERLFLVELKNKYFNDEDTIILSNLDLNESGIAKDIYLINKARIERLQPKLDNKEPENYKLGSVYIKQFDYDGTFIEGIENNYFGLMHDLFGENNKYELLKSFPILLGLESDIFKSNNISKLLDKRYRSTLIKKVCES